MEDGRLTKQEGTAVSKVHHGIEGKTVAQAAAEMGITERAVRYLLTSAEKKAPHLFPILTHGQAKILHMYEIEGMSAQEIALARSVSVNTIHHTLKKLREKGALKEGGSQRPLSFDEATMSDRVVRKW